MSNRKINIDDIAFDFSVPNEEKYLKIYEHYLSILNLGESGNQYETDDLAKFPKKEWYAKMKNLIDEVGFEEYRNHVKFNLENLRILQSSHNRIENWIKVDTKKTNKFLNTPNYIERSSNDYRSFQEPPTHYYFYASERGRYLKGMILSLSCIPDPILLKLIETFSIECPFQVGGHSQAPTGLYVYDALEVFSNLEYPKSIPYIMNFKAKIKQTWAQKRFDKYLKQIAKKQKIEFEEIIENGLSDYGFNKDHIYLNEVGDYKVQLSFPIIDKKEVFWIHKESNKKQKSVPKEIKEDFPERLKYIKTHIKDVETQLKSQSKRIENQLLIDRSWEVDFWNEKYLQHPFVGIISKKLLWVLISGDTRVVVFFQDGTLKSIEGNPISINDFQLVKLWHPKHGINGNLEKPKSILTPQPFKQIERESYGEEFIMKSNGSKMKKSVLSQLCKSRNWTSSANHNLKIPTIDLIAELILKESNDGTRGIFHGSQNVEFQGIKFKKNKNEIEPGEINEITLSEVLRDLDLFISAAKSE